MKTAKLKKLKIIKSNYKRFAYVDHNKNLQNQRFQITDTITTLRGFKNGELNGISIKIDK